MRKALLPHNGEICTNKEDADECWTLIGLCHFQEDTLVSVMGCNHDVFPFPAGALIHLAKRTMTVPTKATVNIFFFAFIVKKLEFLVCVCNFTSLIFFGRYVS